MSENILKDSFTETKATEQVQIDIDRIKTEPKYRVDVSAFNAAIIRCVRNSIVSESPVGVIAQYPGPDKITYDQAAYILRAYGILEF
jgi:hypothetical protein